jgi:hypothetical protein
LQQHFRSRGFLGQRPGFNDEFGAAGRGLAGSQAKADAKGLRGNSELNNNRFGQLRVNEGNGTIPQIRFVPEDGLKRKVWNEDGREHENG